MQKTVKTSEIIGNGLDKDGKVELGAYGYADVAYPAPTALGEGSFRLIRIEDDIGFVFIEHEPMEDFVSTLTAFDQKMVKLGFARSIGKGATAWADGFRERTAIAPGALLIGSASSINHFIDAPLVASDMANLFIGPGHITAYLEGLAAGEDDFVRRFAQEPDGETAVAFSRFDYRAEFAFRQVEACPFEGSVKRLYLEGKVLELVALCLHYSQGTRASRSAGLSRVDEARMRRVQEYVDSEIREPPSLETLARWAGVSLAKLKRDYKAVFGCAIHQHVVEKRMESAKAYIEKDGMSVKEAAYVCGYKSAAHFREAFRRRYGINPSDKLRPRVK